MKDYPDRMTAEQVRKFGQNVLNIVAQIPYGRVTTYGHIDTSLHPRCRIPSLSSGGE